MTAPAAAANDEPVPFHLEYLAPPDCADQATWVRELARRSARLVLVEADRPAPSLRVTLSTTPDGVRAELTAVDLDGRETSRTLSATTCVEAVQGSAWISALWLDPFASEPMPEAPAASEEKPSPPTPPEPAPVSVPPSADTRSAGASLPPASPPSWRLAIGAGAQVGVFFSALPGSPLGFGGFLELQLRGTRVVSPALRLEYVSAGEGVGATDRGNARVSLYGLRAIGCPIEWPSKSRFGMRPCAFGEWGRLRGSGEQTSASSNIDVTWLTAGLLARFAFVILPLVSLEAEAGLVFPLRRDRFVFGPPPVVSGFTVPAVAGTFALGFTIGAPVTGR